MRYFFEFIHISGQADYFLRELFHVFADDFLCVALGVDGDENRLDVNGFRVYISEVINVSVKCSQMENASTACLTLSRLQPSSPFHRDICPDNV